MRLLALCRPRFCTSVLARCSLAKQLLLAQQLFDRPPVSAVLLHVA